MSTIGNNLWYLDINFSRDGRPLSRDEIRKERIRKGFCTECRGVPPSKKVEACPILEN